jgi:hypothetical protein
VLWGPSADDYAESHLVRESVAESASEVVYRCAHSKRSWVMDTEPDQDGVPALRLRWLLSAPDLIAHLAEVADAHTTLAFTHPEVEFRPVGGTEVFHGIEDARRERLKWENAPEQPKVAAVSMLERGDDVVVFGSISQKRDGDYTEHVPAAWLVTVRHGRIARNLWFDSWEAARRAAGIAPDDPTVKTRRLGHGFRWTQGNVDLAPG